MTIIEEHYHAHPDVVKLIQGYRFVNTEEKRYMFWNAMLDVLIYDLEQMASKENGD